MDELKVQGIDIAWTAWSFFLVLVGVDFHSRDNTLSYLHHSVMDDILNLDSYMEQLFKSVDQLSDHMFEELGLQILYYNLDMIFYKCRLAMLTTIPLQRKRISRISPPIHVEWSPTLSSLCPAEHCKNTGLRRLWFLKFGLRNFQCQEPFDGGSHQQSLE